MSMRNGHTTLYLPQDQTYVLGREFNRQYCSLRFFRQASWDRTLRSLPERGLWDKYNVSNCRSWLSLWNGKTSVSQQEELKRLVAGCWCYQLGVVRVYPNLTRSEDHATGLCDPEHYSTQNMNEFVPLPVGPLLCENWTYFVICYC